jgi:tricorn protease
MKGVPMKTLNYLITSILLFSCTSLFAEAYLMRFADVSAEHIVFTYENDLWLVPIDGGKAKRITRSEGTEIFAKFSPDGRHLAFTANYDGGSDIYLMDTHGGIPKRLTFHPADDMVLDWFPDGEHILFRSRREWPYRADMLYKVSMNGGMPEKLPVDRAGLASVSEDGKMLAYNRVSREFRTWKRHQGGTAQNIWFGFLDKKDYLPITDFAGTDNFPMWYNGQIYFTSDREDGTLNLYRIDPQTRETRRLTFFNDYDVRYPSQGDHYIVFQYAGSLYLFDLQNETAQPDKVPIEIPSDGVLIREEVIDAARFTGAFTLSPSGTRALIEMRGEIINFPGEEGIVYNLSQASGSREKNPAWSPDGKKVVFLSDRSGEEELYLVNPEGGPWKQLTKGGKGFRMQPVWSPDSKWLIFHDKFMRLNLVDALSGNITVIDKSDFDDAWERWGIQDYVWSPDSRWIAYSKMEVNMNESIFLYSMANKKSYRVTSDMTQDWSPSFSRDGRYLYFLSNRTYNPVMGFVDQNHIFLDMAKPYILILKEGDPTPFAPKNDREPAAESKAESRADNVIISPLANFENRVVAAPLKAANLFRLEAIEGGFLFLKKTENEFLKYQTVTDANSGTNLDLYKFDLSSAKDRLLMNGISQYHLSADAKKLIYKAGSTFGVVNAGSEAKVGDGKLDLGAAKIRINKQEEFLQMFNEAWRIQRDWFYDANMHAINWDKVGAMYRKFVPYCGTREDLNFLIGEMIGELNIGHTYVYGGDSKNPQRISTGFLGVDFTYDSPKSYPRIGRIIPGEPWNDAALSPLETPGCPIKEGDYILAIDGVSIESGANIYQYLQNKAGQVVEITYNSKPQLATARTYLVKTLRSEYYLRYYEWTRNNLQYVWNKSNDAVGYIHLPGMMENGLIEFAKGYFPQHTKKGLIIDARYNGGGFTSKQIHDRLERTLNTMVQPREAEPGRVPERTFHGHYVLLINRDTGSDGEIFSDAWKARNMGPVIGERTWGGAVGIEAHQNLVDGGGVTPPQFGEYNFKGEWIIEGHGVDPDIIVVNMPKDVLAGKDTQLERAIEVILDKIKNEPMPLPQRPPYPDKSKPTLK